MTTPHLHSIILSDDGDQFIVVPFDPAHDTVFRHPSRELVEAECRWMNAVVEAVGDLEDTDIKAKSPHTQRDFYVCGPVSVAEQAAIAIMVGAASSNI